MAGDWELKARFTQFYRALPDVFMDQIAMHRTQAMVLCRLFAQDGMTQSEIAQRIAVQGGTITNILQRMEEAGFVTRRRDPEDNRLVRVYLTNMGREKECFILDQFAKLENAIFKYQPLSVEEVKLTGYELRSSNSIRNIYYPAQ